MVEAADATEEIHFVAGEANSYIIETEDAPASPGGQRGTRVGAPRTGCAKHSGWKPLHLFDGAGRNGRKQVGALDAVSLLGRFYVQRRHTQVAVIDERQRDQLFKLRIRKELAPAYVGSSQGT